MGGEEWAEGRMNRTLTATAKLAAEDTGLRAALYVHVDHTPDGRATAVRISSPGKLAQTQLEGVFDRIGEKVTELLAEVRG